MRKFKLINSIGEELDLNDKSHFFGAPDGLGYEKAISAIESGYSYIETDCTLLQKQISGEMRFSGYDQYSEFSRFSRGDLQLGYMPIDTWYFVKCKIGSLGKGEITANQLICPIVFICSTTWFEQLAVKKTNLSAAGKAYPFSYKYTYRDSTSGTVVVDDVSMDSPCRIEIMGQAINPVWALSVNGKVVARGKINATIPQGHKLVVDSSPLSFEISEYTVSNEFIRNLYQSSDFSTARFIVLQQGKNTISFSHDGTSELTAYVEVSKRAESV